MKAEKLLSDLAVWKRDQAYKFRSNGIRRPGRNVLEMERLKDTQREFENHFRTTMLTVVGGAFAFVMALFWNDAIKETIIMIVPTSQTLFYKYLAAVLVTLIGVIALFLMAKLFKGK